MSDKNEKLQDAIGMIKDEYIEEAHATSVAESHAEPANASVVQIPKRKGKKTAGIIAVAASVVLALGVGVMILTTVMAPSGSDSMTAVPMKMTEEREGAYAPEAMSDGAVSDGATSGSAREYNSASGVAPRGREEGKSHVLTAGEWNDNANWPFFTNLVNSGAIHFPVFGLDPTHRVKATLVDASGNPVRGEKAVLLDASGAELWSAVSDKEGVAYLFYQDGQTPDSVSAGGVSGVLETPSDDSENQQGNLVMQRTNEVTLTLSSAVATPKGLQVMFIVDTTGSMSDEIAYLQKDFASIAEAVGNDGVEYSANFYRDAGDEYVTKCNSFTSNVGEVQSQLNAEYADGGGDAPEAVADILAETITSNSGWRDGTNKVAFLIYDAPPHEGTEGVLDAAVRSAAERGIRLVPVVSSNADRDTELFGRALAIMTDGGYVFLTDDSGVGESHLEPIVGDYTVEPLHDIIVRIINENR